MNASGRRLVVLFVLVMANCAWAANVSPVAAVGDGTYRITVAATHKFTRNTAKLKEQAMAAASEFCTKEGRTLKVVSVDEDRPQYLVGRFAGVTLTFKALAPGDPELAPVPVASAAVVPVAAPKPMTTDELRAELTKLDELRKQGLLNEAEFEALKKKILDRF